MTYGLTPQQTHLMGVNYARKLKGKPPLYACACCGRYWTIELLDAKPERFAGPGRLIDRIFPKARWIDKLVGPRRYRLLFDDHGEDFDRLECKRCYGPGWAIGVPE